MPNSKELFDELVNKVTLNESSEEIRSMVYLLLESRLGLSKTKIIAATKLEEVDRSGLEEMIWRINSKEPIQYVLGEAWFYGLRFKLSPAVLIPRPETEGLVRELLRTAFLSEAEGPILDIGTGSGCLAVTLAKEFPGRKIIATDVSSEVLRVAEENAILNQASVELLHHNILREDLPFRGIAFIVSNPPYIKPSEKESMNSNVLDHEPGIALFVPENDPLIFYRAIAERGKRALTPGGTIIVEINELYGREVASCFTGLGYGNISVLQDFAGKDRYVSATAIP